MPPRRSPFVNLFLVSSLVDYGLNLGDHNFDSFIKCSDLFLAYLKDEPKEIISSAARVYWAVWNARGWDRSRSLLVNADCDPFLVHTLAASYHYKLGWKHRGTSLYHLVSTAQRRRFNYELHSAAFHALAAMKLYPGQTESPSVLLNIANTSEVDIGRPRAWFLYGIGTNVNHRHFHVAYLRSPYPKWGGSERKMQEFATACAQCTRLDTIAPFFALDRLKERQEQIGEGGRQPLVTSDSPTALSSLLFAIRAVWASPYMWLTGRRFYRDNPFEREAYDVDGGEHDGTL